MIKHNSYNNYHLHLKITPLVHKQMSFHLVSEKGISPKLVVKGHC